VMCMTPKFWQAMCRGVGHPEWLEDARFATPASRRQHREELSALMDAAFGTQPTQHWMDRLAGEFPIAPVLDMAQALDNPYVHRTGMLQHLPHPANPGQRVVANPVRVDGQRLPGQVCSPLGADTDALLREAGFSDEECAQLRAENVT